MKTTCLSKSGHRYNTAAFRERKDIKHQEFSPVSIEIELVFGISSP
jgi:hypothetical protein